MAAQDAELKLKVSLDLAFFRQQLAGLGQAAAGTPMPVQIKFDRRSVQNELNALGANIKRRNYTLNVNTNLKAEIENASKLAKALDELSRSRNTAQKSINQQLGLGVLMQGPQSGGLGSKDVIKLYRAAAQAGLLEYNKEIARTKASTIAALEEVGADSVRGLLNGLNSEDEKLRAAATYLGETLIKTVKNVLGIASPSREFKKIGQNVGEGFQQGMLSSMDKAFGAVEGLMRARMKVLDTIARGMFRMAGIDPVALRAEAAQRRALPGVNFPATVPPRNVPIGPSGTGRALPPGATPSALPGTAFGAQKYLPTALGEELKAILRGAAFAFVDSLKQQVRSVRVGLGATQQPLLSPSRIAGLLPAGVGRAPSIYSTGAMGGETRAEMMARREREARIRSDLRGMDVLGGGAGRAPSTYSYAYRSARPTSAIVPYASGGAIVPQPSMAGGGNAPPSGGGGFGGMGGFGGFGRALGNVPNLPGTGTIRELGSEFAFATKQVLLFGQAYKLLGIIQAFPAQVGAAVGQLQSFRNTLNEVTPSAEEARASNELLLGLMEKYNVPLQSARDGFTKLYASMAPAGFSGDEIRDLFTGITKAAATFGMSADKVDRVNYAFAQMASKGQVMSEELKGQLGDVLPGAMALFAKAAGFKGSKAIQDFSAALEDGAYKGKAMVALLKNVTVVMNKEFGPGAEGAALTFQGVMNRMQNSMTLLYESFEPVAVGFLNTVVVPMTNGIKQITDGLNAFFTGTTASTSGGGVFALQLQNMLPAIEGIKNNVTGLIPVFQQFGAIVGQLAQLLLQIVGNPVVGYLAKLYLVALPLNIAFNVLTNVIRSVIGSMTALNVGLLAGSQRFATYRILMDATGISAAKLTGILRGVAPALNLITVGLRAIAGPAILVGVSLLIERFMMLKGAIDGVGQSTKQMLAGISSMANAGAVGALKNTANDLQKQIQTFEKLRPFVSGGALGPSQKLTPEAAKTMEELGMGSFVSKTILGKPQINDFVNASKIIEARLQGLRKAAAGVQEKLPLAKRVAASIETQTKPTQTIMPIPPSEGDGKEKKGKELDQYIQDATNALTLEKERQLVAIEDKMLRDEISETEAKRQSLLIEKLYEEKAVTEALRVAQIKLADDNLSAADKQLKLADLRAEKEQKIANIGAKYGVEVLKLELGLQQPIKDAISGVNEQLDEQAMIRENLKEGLTDLTYDQKAYLDVQRLTKDYGDAEKESVRERINEYQRLREAYYKNEEALKRQQALVEAEAGLGIIGGGLRAGFTGSAANIFEQTMAQTQGDVDYATKLANIETAAMQLRSVFEGLQGAIAGVSSAFANVLTEGVANMISGTATAKEVFASFLQSIGQALSQAASQMIATYIAIGIAKLFAGLGGGGGADMSKSGITEGTLAPMRQYTDAAGNMAPNLTFANGGIAPGGFQAFANGGVVSGPTLGLVGEGRYNEAVVPLPNGRAIPVQINGERSARDLMGRNAPGMANAAPLTLKFESTKINGVEYVSREQLELAMAETRRASIAGGATRGMNMALDKIQQSPSTRSRIGIR
jgi:tape measure domain-containing protein